jgi:hypothetical protein
MGDGRIQITSSIFRDGEIGNLKFWVVGRMIDVFNGMVHRFYFEGQVRAAPPFGGEIGS